MTQTIWYIHGASSTPRAFNWLHTQLPDHNRVDITYQDHEVDSVMPALLKKLEFMVDPVSIIGHSLGGCFGVALSQATDKIKKVFTISSPFGGSEIASYLRWISFDPLMAYIHPQSKFMRGIRKNPLRAPVVSVVTTSSRFPLTMMYEKNDGVVTYKSQIAIEGPSYKELELNHFEVLLAKETADYCNEFLF